jgi:hypothetical protein
MKGLKPNTMQTILKRTFVGLLSTVLIMSLPVHRLRAQGKLSIDKVYSVYLRNGGTIIEKGQIKGYFFLYESDKVDKHTSEYTLQLLDENLNKVKAIKFQDSKQLTLLESAYNGTTVAFLFKNDDDKTLDMKIYDFDGRLKYSYSNGFDKRTDDLMKRYMVLHSDEGMNKNVFDVGDQGYVSVLPLREGSARTYEVDYYSSTTKKQWNYTPEDAEKYAFAEYLGSTDSLIILEVLKRNHALGGDISSHLVGINFVTRKKQFDIENANDAYRFVPCNVAPLEGSNNLLVIGSFYDKNANVGKDYSKGLAMYEITTGGKVVNRTYNTWIEDFGKYLTTNSRGKIDQVGYLYIHRVIRTPDHKLFIVGEGYKRQASATGIAMSVLTMSDAGVTKVVVTDMVIMEFDDKFRVKNATIFDKTNNTALSGPASDYNSQHLLALYLKASGAFDYEFTTGDESNSNFAVCYSDYEHSAEYHGQTFNAIRYNGSKLTTDKIELKSKASKMRVLPAKGGSVMILEYFKKDKRLDCRLEKLG